MRSLVLARHALSLCAVHLLILVFVNVHAARAGRVEVLDLDLVDDVVLRELGQRRPRGKGGLERRHRFGRERVREVDLERDDELSVVVRAVRGHPLFGNDLERVCKYPDSVAAKVNRVSAGLMSVRRRRT